MNDLTTLAYELGDLIDSMPEFDADSIYYTWEGHDEECKLCFDWHTGKWLEGPDGVPFEIIGKFTQPKAYELRDKMTEIVEASNDD